MLLALVRPVILFHAGETNVRTEKEAVVERLTILVYDNLIQQWQISLRDIE